MDFGLGLLGRVRLKVECWGVVDCIIIFIRMSLKDFEIGSKLGKKFFTKAKERIR